MQLWFQFWAWFMYKRKNSIRGSNHVFTVHLASTAQRVDFTRYGICRYRNRQWIWLVSLFVHSRHCRLSNHSKFQTSTSSKSKPKPKFEADSNSKSESEFAAPKTAYPCKKCDRDSHGNSMSFSVPNRQPSGRNWHQILWLFHVVYPGSLCFSCSNMTWILDKFKSWNSHGIC